MREERRGKKKIDQGNSPNGGRRGTPGRPREPRKPPRGQAVRAGPWWFTRGALRSCLHSVPFAKALRNRMPAESLWDLCARVEQVRRATAGVHQTRVTDMSERECKCARCAAHTPQVLICVLVSCPCSCGCVRCSSNAAETAGAGH